MTNYTIRRIEEFDDVEVKNAWKAEVLTKQVDPQEFLAHMLKTSRDHSRTPMQWNDSENAGFTSAKRAWLAVNPNYREINARRAQADSDSVYNYFRQLIELRRKTPALVYGDYHDLDPINPAIFSYTRTLGPERFLIVLNFSRDEAAYSFPEGLKAKGLLTSNLRTSEENTTLANLRGWEARIYKA